MTPRPATAELTTVSRTSLWVAGLRALETERDDAVFRDPYARALAGAEYATARDLSRADPRTELNPILLRTRFSDAVLRHAVDRGMRQVAILGAGMDTRAYRLPLPADLTIWEVDLAAPLAYKRRVLESLSARPTCRRIPVAADVAGAFGEALVRAGLRPDRPVLWLVEGLLLYLPAAVADALAATVAGLSAAGSRLVFDAYGAEAFTADSMSGWNDAVRDWGAALDRPVGWIAAHGWTATAYTRQDVAAGRCPWAAPRPARVTEAFLDHSWLVHAERPGRTARTGAAGKPPVHAGKENG
jgi:methyltransferase (TIGR00027 family)